MSSLKRPAKRDNPDGGKAAEREVEVPLNKVRFDPNQPRQAFHHIDGRVASDDEEYITELAESIKKNGLIQLPTYQAMSDGNYLVVIGERRTRAHLKLGLPTIRAVIRNDLTSPARRLLYQLAENINRKDLTDDEMAAAIKKLMDGVNGDEPMSQVEIAGYFGKSEGWVTRFVKFGDEELQRIWVKPGIADTVEKLYRLSILPKTVQLDILRRVDLSEGNPEKLEKPLNRNVIDLLAREAKAQKSEKRNQIQALMPEISQINGLSVESSIEQAINDQQTAKSLPIPTGGYVLSDLERTKLLGSMPVDDVSEVKSARDSIAPPVNCRISMTNVNALLNLVKSNPRIFKTLDAVRCDLSIPVPIAKQFANELMGIIVDDREVSAILQNELSKLK